MNDFPTDKQHILVIDQVKKQYITKISFLGRQRKEIIALNTLSLNLHDGEIFGLVGESGSGKTTLGRLIVKLEQPDEGSIYLKGKEIFNLKGIDKTRFPRHVQMIFQDPYQSLNPQFNVYDTISEPLTIHRINHSRSDNMKDVFEIMTAVGLSPPEDYIHRFPHQLSGGQRQRAAVARAMILKPNVLVADEPTSMLDASISAHIFNILLEMRKKYSVAILFITHNLAAARYLSDRIGIIYRGNLMEIGPTDHLLHHPRHPYTQALIDALPKLGGSDRINRYNTLLKPERSTVDEKGCPFYSRCKRADETLCSRAKPRLEPCRSEHRTACFMAAEQPNGVVFPIDGPIP